MPRIIVYLILALGLFALSASVPGQIQVLPNGFPIYKFVDQGHACYVVEYRSYSNWTGIDDRYGMGVGAAISCVPN